MTDAACPAPAKSPALNLRQALDFFAYLLAVADPAARNLKDDTAVDAFAHANRDHFRQEARRLIAVATPAKEPAR